MRRSDFRDGYLDQRAYLQRDPHPLRGDLLQKGAKWSETFAVHLDQVLSGEHLSDEAASTTLGGYSYWLRNDFTRNMTRMDELFSDDPDIDITLDFFLGMGFHALNASMLEMWQAALTGRRLSKHARQHVQNNLAIYSVQLMAPLVDAHKKGELFTWNKDHFKVSDPISRGVMGIASESDATLGLLQGLADAPDIYILPSPDKYEHSCNQSDRNSDLILLDPTNETAHGIQVKTSTRGIAKHREYDPAFVTVIDNEQDLKNLIYLRQPGRSDSSPVAMPGLYAAHYLAQQKGLHRHGQPKGKNMILNHVPLTAMRSKYLAGEIAHLAEPVNKQVTEHLCRVALECLVVVDAPDSSDTAPSNSPVMKV